MTSIIRIADIKNRIRGIKEIRFNDINNSDFFYPKLYILDISVIELLISDTELMISKILFSMSSIEFLIPLNNYWYQ